MFDFFKRRFRKKPENLPAFWEDYLALFEKSLQKKDSFRSLRFVVFDTETTGLNIKKDRICQIGALGIQDNTVRLQDFFDTLVHQQSGGISKVKEVHGLRDETIQTGMDERQALIKFVEYLGNSVIVAHHALFDIGMINQSLKRHFGKAFKLKNKYLDTALLEKRLRQPGAYAVEHPLDLSLDALAAQYGIALHDRHTAIGDAFITAQLFMKIVIRLEKRGVKSIGNLLDK